MCRYALFIAILSLVSQSCTTAETDVQSQAWSNVYGEDDRQQPFEPSDVLDTTQETRFEAYGHERVGMFVRDRRVRLNNPDQILLCNSNTEDYPSGDESDCFTRTLDWRVFSSSSFGDDEIPLCEDEIYRLEPAIGRCSGTLIADDLVLTSGHCFDADNDVSTSIFVFNFRYERIPDSPGSIHWFPVPNTEMDAGPSMLMEAGVPDISDAGIEDAGSAEATDAEMATPREVAQWVEWPVPGLANITRADIYHAVNARFVMLREMRTRPSGNPTTSTVQDYAIVQLDRPVSRPRRPAPIRYAMTPPPADTPLTVLAFGKGMPLKRDDGARVLDNWYCDPEFNPPMLCNTHDGYSGASGAGLFSQDGILLAAHRGSATDFVYDRTDDCYRSRVVDDEVPDNEFPATAHQVAWALDDFCVLGFAPDSPICGDPRYLRTDTSSCEDGVLSAYDNLGCCHRACTADIDCEVPGWGGHCNSDGTCQRSAGCFAGELWTRDACGRPITPIEGSFEACLGMGDACESAEPLAPTSQTLELRLDAQHDHERGSCGGYGADHVLQFEITEPHGFEARLAIAEDADASAWLLYLRSGDCTEDATERSCDHGTSARAPSLRQTLSPGVYQLVVDSEPNDERMEHPWETSITLEVAFENLAPPPEDAGVSEMDAGPADVGMPSTATDAAVDAADAVPSSTDGCNCGVAARQSPPLWFWGAVSLVLLGRVRRRGSLRPRS